MSTTCEQMGAELVAFLDDELTTAERAPVVAHVATCLVCRREIERLQTVQTWVGRLPPVEPHPAFAEDFWRRIASEPTLIAAGRRGWRTVRWSMPALAAAAVLVLALQSLLRPPAPPQGPAAAPSTRVAAAPAGPAVREAPAKVATQTKPEPVRSEPEAPQVANVESLRPEDLPPELLEHPELFLRLPVVRRLETLEYFGSASDRRPSREDGAG